MSEVEWGLSQEEIKKIRSIFLRVGKEDPSFLSEVYDLWYEYHVPSPIRGMFIGCIENAFDWEDVATALAESSGVSRDTANREVVSRYIDVEDRFSVNFLRAMRAKGYKAYYNNNSLSDQDLLKWVVFDGVLEEGNLECPYFDNGKERIYLSELRVLYSYEGEPLMVVYGDNEDLLYSVHSKSCVQVAKAIKLELGLDDVVDIFISSYILALSDGLALSLLTGTVVGGDDCGGLQLTLGVEGKMASVVKEFNQLLPRIGDSKKWSNPKVIDRRISLLANEISDAVKGIVLLHLWDNGSQWGVSLDSKVLFPWSDVDKYKIHFYLRERVLKAVVDSYGNAIKEAYFLINSDSDYLLGEVMAYKNPDGELTLFFY